MRFHTLIIYILAIAAAIPAFSAPANTPVTSSGDHQRATRYYNAPPNLTSNIYTDFCQDRKGYIWIATETGLMRFDGFNLEVFRNDKQRQGTISDNRVNRVICDSRGDIWVGTSNGLNYFDPESETFEVVKLPPSEKIDGYVQDIAEQADGTIIFNVAGNGLYLVDPAIDKKEAARMAISSPRFEGNSIYVAKDKKIFLGTHRGHIQVIKPNGSQTELPLSDSFIEGISHEHGNTIVVYGQERIWRIDTKTLKAYEIDASAMGKAVINKISHDKDGNAYIASNSGLWMIRKGGNKVERCARFFNSSVDLDRVKIGSVYAAPDGNIWIGCDYQGVVMAPTKPLPFAYHPLTSKVKEFKGGISTIAHNRFGTWIALEDGDVLRLDSDGHPGLRVSIPGAGSVTCLFLDDDDTLYATTSNAGLWKVNPASGAASKIAELPRHAARYNINKADNSSVLYISIIGEGLFIYNSTTGDWRELKTTSPGIKNLYSDWISSSFIDSKGRLWLGSFSGLSCYDTMKQTFHVIDQSPFMKMAIHAICETADGKILLGTSDGLLIYNPGKDTVEKTLTKTDGLADSDIRIIQPDDNGTVWLGTLLGISSFNPSTGEISSIRGGYGLSEIAFRYSSFNPAAGEMTFAGNLGYTTFNPREVRTAEITRPPYISGIYLNGLKMTDDDTVDGKGALTSDPETGYSKVLISYRDNNLLVKVSTMDFRDAENVVIERKMEGSKEWTAAQPGNSSIVIPKLGPGDYTLLIRASDNGSYSPVTKLHIHVTAPWYGSVPAKLFYLLAAVALVTLLFMLYRKRNTERLNDAKVKFFMDISHEIRSPMTCIIAPLESLMKKDFDPDTKRLLSGMHRNAGRILSLANQLLEIRKIDKGKKTLTMRPTDLRGFTAEIVDLYRQMAESKNIKISLDMPDDFPQVWIDRANFDKVLVNLITNAIKYTPDNGKITVSISQDNDPMLGQCARIAVTDTGIGLDPKNIEKLFDRFYQGRGSASGFGVGLDLARQIAMLHHGTLKAANRSDGVKGSVFTVSVPLGNAHLSSRETGGEDASDTPAAASGMSHIIRSDEEAGHSTPMKASLSRRILIADDDAELLDYLCEHYSHFVKVEKARNGNEAMKILLTKKIDLVISDVMMPEMDGLTLLRTIKANVDTNHIPVVLLSTRGEVADRLAGWGEGADGYVGKPFDMSELDAIVDNFIENRLRMKGKYSGVQASTEKISSPEIKGNDEILMDRVIKAIESHLDDNQFNVENLSEEVGISRAHLHRRLKELAGMSPSDFIRNVKIKRACDMLRKPDIDVSQVAFCLGFSSQPHFSTTFKKFTGMTPSEYRTQILQKAEKTVEE